MILCAFLHFKNASCLFFVVVRGKSMDTSENSASIEGIAIKRWSLVYFRRMIGQSP